MRQFRSWIAAASILSACATAGAPAAPPPELRGCWIERRGEDTLTMRWFPDRDDPGVWRGDLLLYSPGQEPAPQQFRLAPAAGERMQFGWAICQIEEPTGPPCRAAFFREAHIDDEGADWMELHASADRLKFSYETGEEQLVLFDGARDGCD